VGHTRLNVRSGHTRLTRYALEYLQETVTLGRSPDPEKIDSLTLGVDAAREFETSGPDRADVLSKVHYLANRMQ
jgi:hypothetical protein